MVFLLLPPATFLAGSIPWGRLLTRLFAAVDITRAGSGNIGATNVSRTAGRTLGLLTLLGDMAKGALPVALAKVLFEAPGPWQEGYIAGIALLAVLGHLFPVFSRFRGGGKGVATAAGCFGALSPVALVILVMVFIMIFCYFSRISLASLTASLAAPPVIWEATLSPVFSGFAGICAVLIWIRHKDNLRRLITGAEPPFL
jgi:glycerol-3-phosphate acyltransferase PlsY